MFVKIVYFYRLNINWQMEYFKCESIAIFTGNNYPDKINQNFLY